MCAENPVVEAKAKETQALKDVARCTFWSRFPTDPELEYPTISSANKYRVGSSGDYR